MKNQKKIRSTDIKKRVTNDFVLKKDKYPRTVTAVQRKSLNYQPNYNSNRQFQSQGVSNQIMLAQRGKTGDDEGKTKEDKQTPQINLDHINCKNGGEKSHYARNSE